MLAIIDGDVLAYQACRSRWASPAIRAAENAQSFVKLDDDGNRVMPEFTKEDDAAYMTECWENFQGDLNKLLETVYADDYVMAVKGTGCFRKMLYPEYKMNRHGDNKPQRYLSNFVPSIRELAIFEDLAIPANMCEADDLIRIWANEAAEAGVDHIVCSIDKDLRCIPGNHYVMHYDDKKRGPLQISEDEARRFYYQQLIMGDPTDNIPGVPRVGPVKAQKMIAGCVSEEDMQECVVEQYLGAYGPDHWFENFLMNGKLIHIQTHWNDYFECHKWPIIKELT